MVYGVIMAGGIGSRFWPRSREAHPKQFLNVFGSATLLQQTAQRIAPLISPEHTVVVTHERYREQTLEQLPDIRPELVLGEPVSRNTAPCIAYAAVRLRQLDPDAIMVVLPADHLVQDEDEFRSALRQAIEAARMRDALVTIGIRPTHAATGYGYLQYDDSDQELSNVYQVRTFAEKPDEPTAERFLDSGDFLWNSGIFVWKADTILAKLRLHLRTTWQAFANTVPHLGTSGEAQAVRAAYYRSARTSIDYGVMEHADDVLTVRGAFGWSDIGDWRAVYDLSKKDRHGNVLPGNSIVRNASRCMVQGGDRLVALVGVHDLVVVDTEDALLVCSMDSTQQVKIIVEYLHAHQRRKFV